MSSRKRLAMDIVKVAYRYPEDVKMILKINSGPNIDARDLAGLMATFATTDVIQLKMFVVEKDMEVLYLEELRSSFKTLFDVYGINYSLYF